MDLKRTVLAATVAAAVLVGCGGGGGDSAGGGEITTTDPATQEALDAIEDLVDDPDGDAAPADDTEDPVDPATTDVPPPTLGPDGGLPPCQDLLRLYADAFDFSDLNPVIVLFRTWAPLMPEEVGAATSRLADAYAAAGGDGTKLRVTDPDLSADATTFSDWTAAGCPTG